MVGTWLWLGAMIMSQPGCQVGVSGSVGGEMFYPDGGKGKEIGDPRKGRYAPGNTGDDEHFHGLGGGQQ
jgi:hypothetical protein